MADSKLVLATGGRKRGYAFRMSAGRRTTATSRSPRLLEAERGTQADRLPMML